MSKREYPISRVEQIELWDECWADALAGNRDIMAAIALAAAMFNYRISVLSGNIGGTNMP